MTPLSFALFVAALTAALPPLEAAPTTPLVFVMPALFFPDASSTVTDADEAVRANRSFIGLSAALHEVNRRSAAAPGSRLSQYDFQAKRHNVKTARTGAGSDGLDADGRIAQIAATPHFAAVVRSAFDGSPSLAPAAGKRNISVVSPMAIDDALSSPASPHVVNFRTKVTDEATQLLQFALNSRYHCRSMLVACFDAPGTVAAGKTIVDKAASIGLGNVTFMTLPPPSTLAQVVSTVLPKAKAMDVSPQCYFVIAPAPWVQAVAEAVHADPQLKASGAAFLAISLSTQNTWRSASGSSAAFARLFNTQVFPHSQDRRFEVIKRYHAALDAAAAAGAIDTSNLAQDRLAAETVEGYIIGRFLEEAYARASTTLTPSTVADVAFRTQLFTIDDLRLGPFVRGCVGDQEAAGEMCWCNSGARVVFMTQVAADGSTKAVVDNATFFESGSARGVIPLSQCTFAPTVPLPSRVMLTVRSPIADAAEAAATDAVTAAWTERLFAARNDGTLSAFVAHPTVATAPAEWAAVKSLATERYEANLIVAPPAAAVVGAPSLLVPTIAPMRYRWLDRDADLIPFTADTVAPLLAKPTLTLADGAAARTTEVHPPTSWDNYLVPFWPTIADFAHTAADYAAVETHRRVLSGAAAAVHIVVDNEELASCARRSVETKARSAPATVRVLDSTASATTLFAGNAGLPANGFVILATQRPDVLTLASSLARATQATVLLCTSELVLDDHRPASPPSNLLVLSGLRGISPNTTARTAYGHVLGDIAARVAVTVGSSAGVPLSPPHMVAQLYAATGISAGGVSLRPLSQIPCPGLTEPTFPHPGGRCQCHKGLNTFFVLSASNTANVLAEYTHEECGVRYVPLPDAESDSKSMLVTALAISLSLFAVALAACALLWLLCRAPRIDTTCAPKDATEPFAVVFTDIQASTTLWARVPQHMGPALDVHHALIRALISKHRGYEVKTIGDSFMVAFKDVSDATDFALAVQDALYDHDWGTSIFDETYAELISDHYPEWTAGRDCTSAVHDRSPPPDVVAVTVPWRGLRVRVGVHYGTGEIKIDETTGGYDYYGTVVNTAARIEGVGHGGQVLLSGAAFDALGFQRQTELCTLDLGAQQLRGLEDTVPLHQVEVGRLRHRQFPPLRLDVEVDVNGGGTASDHSSAAKTHSSKGQEYLVSEGGSLHNSTSHVTVSRKSVEHSSDATAKLTTEAFARYLLSKHNIQRNTAPRRRSTGPFSEIPRVGTQPHLRRTDLDLAVLSAEPSISSGVTSVGVAEDTTTRHQPMGDPLTSLLTIHTALFTPVSPSDERAQRLFADKLAHSWRVGSHRGLHQRRAAREIGTVSASLMQVAVMVYLAMESSRPAALGSSAHRPSTLAFSTSHLSIHSEGSSEAEKAIRAGSRKASLSEGPPGIVCSE